MLHLYTQLSDEEVQLIRRQKEHENRLQRLKEVRSQAQLLARQKVTNNIKTRIQRSQDAQIEVQECWETYKADAVASLKSSFEQDLQRLGQAQKLAQKTRQILNKEQRRKQQQSSVFEHYAAQRFHQALLKEKKQRNMEKKSFAQQIKIRKKEIENSREMARQFQAEFDAKQQEIIQENQNNQEIVVNPRSRVKFEGGQTMEEGQNAYSLAKKAKQSCEAQKEQVLKCLQEYKRRAQERGRTAILHWKVKQYQNEMEQEFESRLRLKRKTYAPQHTQKQDWKQVDQQVEQAFIKDMCTNKKNDDNQLQSNLKWTQHQSYGKTFQAKFCNNKIIPKNNKQIYSREKSPCLAEKVDKVIGQLKAGNFRRNKLNTTVKSIGQEEVINSSTTTSNSSSTSSSSTNTTTTQQQTSSTQSFSANKISSKGIINNNINNIDYNNNKTFNNKTINKNTNDSKINNDNEIFNNNNINRYIEQLANIDSNNKLFNSKNISKNNNDSKVHNDNKIFNNNTINRYIEQLANIDWSSEDPTDKNTEAMMKALEQYVNKDFNVNVPSTWSSTSVPDNFNIYSEKNNKNSQKNDNIENIEQQEQERCIGEVFNGNLCSSSCSTSNFDFAFQN